MVFRETLEAQHTSLIEPIQRECSKFYDRYKILVHSIVLTGSLARGEISGRKKGFDADMVLVTRYYYNPFLCRLLERQLSKKVTAIKFDVGRGILLSRLRRERSLFSYDIKNTGIILAGIDVRAVIPSISPSDLYPFESIRLLLNASCHIAFSLDKGEGKIKESLDKALKWCVDAYLIYHGEFAPTHSARIEIAERNHPEFLRGIQDATNSTDVNAKYSAGRLELLNIMNLVRENLELESIEELVHFFEKKCSYPFLFRLYTASISKGLKSFVENPIFQVYQWALKTVSTIGSPLTTNSPMQKHYEKMWTKLPQPMVGAR